VLSAENGEGKMIESAAGAEDPISFDTLRDHLANQRTLLAWSALGGQSVTGLSTAFGVALALCGGLLLAVALRRYVGVGEAIQRRDFRWSPMIGVALAGVL
jgi:uncharacterized membrane protein YidH (DUF202 family)